MGINLIKSIFFALLSVFVVMPGLLVLFGPLMDKTTHKNGIVIEKTSVPFGVVAIIYESRPNVTSDAAALSFKSGNVCVLRSGKEAFSMLEITSYRRYGHLHRPDRERCSRVR